MDDVFDKLVVETGDVLFREGMTGDCAYIIEKGLIEISVKNEGKRIPLGRRGPGEVVGEMAIIDFLPRSATAIARESSVLILISRKQFQSRVSQADPIMQMILSIILERFRRTLGLLQRSKEYLNPLADHEHVIEKDNHQTYDCALREIQLERELKHAIKQDQFIPYFQPIVEIQNKNIIAFEALVRWSHPTKGLVPPSLFIPTAETSGLISKITHSVFQQSTHFLKKTERNIVTTNTNKPLYISINISGHDLGDPTFADQLLTMAHKVDLDIQCINLEITETMLLVDPESVIARLIDLKRAGFSISLDDFGTGYSSLSYLHRFPVDTLKIDQSFIRTMNDSKRNFQIVESIIILAHRLEMDVIAEGIEDEEQRYELELLGCKFGQGYLFATPLPEREAELLYARQMNEQ